MPKAHLNVGEWGVILRIGTIINLAGKTPGIEFIDPDGNKIVKGPLNGVAVGTADFYDNYSGVRVFANKHVIYTVEDGLLSSAGTWQRRVTAANDSLLLMSDYDCFSVNV